MLVNTPQVDIGWKASPFALPDANGAQHTFDELRGENGLLIAFICNHCPYVIAVGHRLAEDARALQKGGRLDDARMDGTANRTPELLNAMRQIAASGTTEIEQIASMGCSIKWKS